MRYALTGGFDVVPLNPRAEVTVPLQGVAWAGVVASASSPTRTCPWPSGHSPTTPCRIKRWDFLAGDRTVTLTWETQRHEGLRAFVVEALENSDASDLDILRRTILPVADNGESSFGYAFVDEETENVPPTGCSPSRRMVSWPRWGRFLCAADRSRKLPGRL